MAGQINEVVVPSLLMQSFSSQIALLIDADNASASRIEQVFGHLSTLGTVRVRRAYGNWKKEHLQGWTKVLHKYAITPIQQFDYVSGKNATDIALTIDAMDLLQTMQPEIFGIVAGDSDYTPLVVRLISSGAEVFGFGHTKPTSIFFQEACTEFIALNSHEVGSGKTVPSPTNIMAGKQDSSNLGSESSVVKSIESSKATEKTPQVPAKTSQEPEKIFHEAVKRNQQSTGWTDVKAIGAYLSKRKIFKANYKVNRWASYYKKFPGLFEVSEKNGKTMVRLQTGK